MLMPKEWEGYLQRSTGSSEFFNFLKENINFMKKLFTCFVNYIYLGLIIFFKI